MGIRTAWQTCGNATRPSSVGDTASRSKAGCNSSGSCTCASRACPAADGALTLAGAPAADPLASAPRALPSGILLAFAPFGLILPGWTRSRLSAKVPTCG